MGDLLHEGLTYKIIGACMEVHRELGCGFAEPVYQEALEQELDLQDIPYHREKEITIEYKGKELEKKYQADFICYEKIIIELKALSELSGDHKAQLLNYLKATDLRVGLLVNFGKRSLKHERIAL